MDAWRYLTLSELGAAITQRSRHPFNLPNTINGTTKHAVIGYLEYLIEQLKKLPEEKKSAESKQ